MSRSLQRGENKGNHAVNRPINNQTAHGPFIPNISTFSWRANGPKFQRLWLSTATGWSISYRRMLKIFIKFITRLPSTEFFKLKYKISVIFGHHYKSTIYGCRKFCRIFVSSLLILIRKASFLCNNAKNKRVIKWRMKGPRNYVELERWDSGARSR